MAPKSTKTQLFDLELSGLVFNQDNTALVRDRHSKTANRDQNYDTHYDFRTFIYDCFYDPELAAVTLLCPPLLNFHKLLAELRVEIDGEQAPISTVEDLSRCSVITLDCPNQAPSMLTLSHPFFGGNLAIGPSFLSHFKDTNAIFTISQNNRLEWIQDWLTHYVKTHGANAVILSDNNSTAYSPSDLRDAICAIPGIEKAAILRARYPFGPKEKESYSALFLQRSLAELCRRRFLGQARAVVSADIDELFYSFSGSSIYDATVASKAGYIRADAKWVYATPNSAGLTLRHRDHKYLSASSKPKANRKWCVVPQGPQKGKQWLTHFLGSRKDPVDPDFRMWHFGQISTGWKHKRTPDRSPKLKVYPALRDTMHNIFGSDNSPELSARYVPLAQNMLIITAMKNEGPFILEWIAYHRAIGFNQFLVYTNDCTDGTDKILDRLQEMGILQHQRNKVLRRGPQKSALKHAKTLDISSNADWILVSDIDEFLNIKIGEGHLQDLLNANSDADVIPVTWRLFSNDTKVEFKNELVIESFNDAQIDVESGGLGKRFVKSLFKPHAKIERFGTHGPIISDENLKEFSWVAPDGFKILDPKEMTRRKSDFSYGAAQINHYATRSVDAYLVKKERGRVNHFKQIMEIDYWIRMCHGGDNDTSIHRHIETTIQGIDSLLQDQQLSELHNKSINWYHKKISELRSLPEYENMRKEILLL